jgi:cyclophilin family peptidyl-prolyl cis-trans isomerase
MKKVILSMLIGLISTTLIQAQSTSKSTAPKEQVVEITTAMGKMKLKLYNETPKHRNNFIKLINDGFYTDLLFHRIIKDFMIQGGDPNSKNASADAMLGSGDVGYTIPAEFNPSLVHKKGALAAARNNNPEKASSGCQFYIVQGRKSTDEELNAMESRNGIKYTEQQRADYKTIGGTAMLDMNYTVFGEVIEGLDVLDKIAAVKTKSPDRPIEDVKFTIKLVK